MAFADVIPVPFRNIHLDVALHHRLASEPRMQLVIGRLFDSIEFVILHLGQVVAALLHHHMARRAGAASAAGMFQMEPKIHRDIEQRFRPAMALIRQLPRLELERFIRWEERNCRH
jgi:hypothetical protein